MKRTLVFISLAFVVACTSHKALTQSPSQSDVDYAAQKWPGTTLADLNQGKTLYEQNCGKCHGLKSPTSRDEQGWNQIVPPMARKAKVDNNTETLILKYLVTASHAGGKK